MSARRNFLRNITMAIAASLVPRILQPAVPEVEEDERVPILFKTFSFSANGYEDLKETTFWIRKKDYEALLNIRQAARLEREDYILREQAL
jgi:hypothetical protein